MPFLGFTGRMLWGSQTSGGLVNSNNKKRLLVKPMGVLSKGCIKHTGAAK